MHSLRTRLILSHILPLLIIIPLIGLILSYILETQVLLKDLTAELETEALQTAAMAAQQSTLWKNVGQAQIFVTQYGDYTRAEVRLLDKNGNLIASNETTDEDNTGQPLTNLPTALAGQNVVRVDYSLSLNTDIVEVMVPVIVGPDKEVIGVVRLSQKISHVQGRINNIRYAIAAVTAGAMVVAMIVGLILALRLERPIRNVTEAIHNVAGGREWHTVPEQGPDELRLLVRAFNTLIERLRVLEDARQRLLANIVHEVGRPIGALQAAIQALLSGADQNPEMRRELLEGMHAEVNRLHPLLDNLTNLHGQILGTMELNCEPIKLNEWLPRTIGPWREAAQNKGLHWHADIPLTLPTVNIDSDRMAQVLGNLLSNAVKYTSAGGNISVSAGAEETQTWIEVQDTGPGLSEEEIARIFEPFYRSQPGRRFPQGMGLGLTIAQDLIVAHGGQLDVDSHPGQGTKFTIQIPHGE